eukprot:CAMPEP_0205961718 /NCGR_PEP_ID=MMETSP1459-20131121/68758_1 /ASSEMBLY_ACC=CAM_ASM_001120 /TAXON_ID=41880 /ORGANISM="Pycnococcus provasolii, Strain RCC931" /LENGTH=34 /DNA_ID= /DNA_START= /DNA_END= /DNA_ORIENTATION=
MSLDDLLPFFACESPVLELMIVSSVSPGWLVIAP